MPEPSLRLSTLELGKEDMKFSAGHFTIFSATERENLHGHNFRVKVLIEAELQADGMCFDYGLYKRRIRKLCAAWDEITILPSLSPHLRIEQDQTHVYAHFNGESIPFLKRDVLLLPIFNATVEEFSRLLLAELTDADEIERFGIHALTVQVYSGPGQSGASSWRRDQPA
ncbi:MAG: 6-pyruvoyl tetrahydropterin synthase [Candidatus Melainabacteria bacterium HGW-Melainabacteria-1]|nr:MAG: 6-pyruvoyl tetrahydropterin synthase [Candidatus Melainabacteria bacterium HGW-Melainabacteria-1]